MSEQKSDDDFSRAVVIGISEPTRIRITRQAFLEVLCYQQVGNQFEGLPMVLRFDREATGKLVASVKGLLESGAITLEKSDQENYLQ